jgi:hypothetical protein
VVSFKVQLVRANPVTPPVVRRSAGLLRLHAVPCCAVLCPVTQVKIITRRAFDRRELQGAELVQLMHGLARVPRYAPNQGWLAAAAAAVQQDLEQLSPGELTNPLDGAAWRALLLRLRRSAFHCCFVVCWLFASECFAAHC